MDRVPYSNVTGNLMYLMICTIPDLAYSSSLINRCMEDPRKKTLGSNQMDNEIFSWNNYCGLLYKRSRSRDLKLYGYVDSSFAGDFNRKRSLTSYAFLSRNNVISWKSNLQSVVALSTTEVELIVATEAIKEATWLKGLIADALNKIQ